MADRPEDTLRVLAVGSRYLSGPEDAGALGWPALVDALRARGDDVRVLTTEVPDAPRPDLPGVDRSLHWFRAADGSWRRPARLEASRISRHGLLRLGDTLQRFKPAVVVWADMGGLPLTLVGASGLPELALVLDDWPVYGPTVDLPARQEGWEPGGAAAWSCANETLRTSMLRALDGGVDPARVRVDPLDVGWTAAIAARIDALAGRTA